MNVKELIKELQNCDPEAIVCFADTYLLNESGGRHYCGVDSVKQSVDYCNKISTYCDEQGRFCPRFESLIEEYPIVILNTEDYEL